jgi:maltooligosyltrehalose trehalohydrolase
VQWHLNDGSALILAANLSSEPAIIDGDSYDGEVLFASASDVQKNQQQGNLSPWSVIFYLEEPQK